MGCSLLLVDFRGAGGSSGQDTTLGFREADDVAASMKYAQAEWPNLRLALYGTSMGAAAVMRAVAEEGVHDDALILESPFNSLLDTTSNRFHSMGLPAFPSAQMLVIWGSVQGGYNGFSNNPSEYAHAIDIPTLLMYGGRDPRVTPQQSRGYLTICVAVRKKCCSRTPGTRRSSPLTPDCGRNGSLLSLGRPADCLFPAGAVSKLGNRLTAWRKLAYLSGMEGLCIRPCAGFAPPGARAGRHGAEMAYVAPSLSPASQARRSGSCSSWK